MKHRLRRLLALALSLAILLSMGSAGAWAAETEDELTEAEDWLTSEEAFNESDDSSVAVDELPTEDSFMEEEVVEESVTEEAMMAPADEHKHDGITFEEWTETDRLPDTPGSYCLTGDVTISGTWNVPGGTTNLCLNGHGIRKTGNSSSVISVTSGRTLNLYDCGSTVQHSFTVPNPAPNGAGMAVVDAERTEGHEIFSGGYITGGCEVSEGGGLNIRGGVVNMYGGNIIGNSTNDGSGTTNGGAVFMDNSAMFTMYGGAIQYNFGRNGASLFVEDGSTFVLEGGSVSYGKGGRGGIFSRGTVKIHGGEVLNHYCTIWESGGFNGWDGTLEITGGTISGNTGVNARLAGIMPASLTLGGNPLISDNLDKNGNQANLYLNDGRVITIASKLSSSVKSNRIGVSMNSGTGVFTSGWSSIMGEADPAEYFFSENSDAIIILLNGEATLVPENYRLIHLLPGENSGEEIAVASESGTEYTLPASPFTSPEGKAFAGWSDGENVYQVGDSYSITQEVTFTAQWAPGTTLTYELADSYGDGWNGAAIQVTDKASGAELVSLSIGNGGSASGSFDVPAGRTIVFSWKPGSYDDECSYTVWDAEGNVVFSGSSSMTSPIEYTYYAPVATVTSGGTSTDYADFAAAVSAWNSADNGSTLTLLKNMETGSTITVSGTKTLDLNGYGIKFTGNFANSNSVIFIRGNGNELTLKDSRPNETTHYFTAPASGAGLATDISDTNSGSQQSFHGGYLTGGNCFSGGGIRVDGGGKLFMQGGTIIGNQGQYGGGMDVERSGSAGGSAVITGGVIMYNYGSEWTGGIHTNHANSLSISNCTITNNAAKNGIGGINWEAENDSATMSCSGNTVIENNMAGGTESNVCLASGKYISVSGTLSGGASIGVTMASPGVFTNSADTTYNDETKFTSDNADYAVEKNADGQLQLIIPPVASVSSGGASTEYADFAAAVSAWNSAESGATLTLLDDVTTGSTIQVSNTRTLDLNGYGITKTGGDNVIWIRGGNLTVNDSNTTTTHYYNMNNGIAVNVNAVSGEKSFHGGYITGGTGHSYDSLFWGDGGGVYLDGGSFTLNGGTILGNSTGSAPNFSDTGGGVEIYSGTMTMNGGTICYNSSGIGLRAGSSAYNRGGGATTATFVMNDGVIANNKKRGVVHDWWCYGDDYATFNGGSVINNGEWGISAKYLTIAGSVTVSGNANGVTFASTTAAISGSPVISGNTGANLKVNNGKTINVSGSLSGANIGITMQTPGVFTNSTDTSLNDASKFTSDNTSYAVFKNADGQLELAIPPVATVTSGGTSTDYADFAAAVSAWNSAASGATLTLLADVTTANTVTDTGTGTKTLDLNGHGICMTGSGSVIRVENGGTWNVTDSAPDTRHKFILRSSYGDGIAGLAAVDDAATGSDVRTFQGGYLTGGTGTPGSLSQDSDMSYGRWGGGVMIVSGIVHMRGGTIIGNSANNGGGGVFATNGNVSGRVAEFHLYDGAAIRYNASEHGGGVRIYKGAVMTMTGGEISHNAATDSNGGGITMTSTSSQDFIMSGGVLAYNYAKEGGGGLNAEWSNTKILSGTAKVQYNVTQSGNGGGVNVTGSGLTLAGDVVITGNTANGVQKNVYISNNRALGVSGTLGEEASIGVTLANGAGVFTTGETTYLDESKFTSDNSSYAVFKNADGQLLLGTPVTVTYKVVNGTWSDDDTADKTETVASGANPASVPTGMKASEGYTGGAWDTDPAEATITGATTFTYTFEAKTPASVTKAPEAKSLTYDGSAQELVSAGTAEGGSMRYALGTNATTAPTEGWATSIPTGTNAGTCYVWYKAIGDASHIDSDPASVSVSIGQKEVGLSWSDTSFTYDGQSHQPSAAASGLVAGDTCTVTVTGEQTDAGTYTATASALSNGSYKLPDSPTTSFTIEKAEPGTPRVTMQGYTYGGTLPTPSIGDYDGGGAVTWYYSTSDSNSGGTAWTDSMTATSLYAGTYYMYAVIVPTENYLGYTTQTSRFEITPGVVTVSGSINFGNYSGNLILSLLSSDGKETVASDSISVSGGKGTYHFEHITQGQYILRASWSEGGAENVLNDELEIR